MLSKPEATLYVAATPLGNLDDVTVRLREVLRAAPVVYAEDTRRSRILLSHLGLDGPLRSLHAHNEQHRCEEVLSHLQAGADVVLLTDAGTPAVSDPGATAVDAAHRAGYRVSPLVGPSALTAALSVAGFGGYAGPVLFVGFLPRSGKERQRALDSLVAHLGTYVFFEAANRLLESLQDVAQRCPARLVCVCREMTKIHEECIRGPASEMLAWGKAANLRGEITVVVGPPLPLQKDAVSADDTALLVALQRCLKQGLSARDATCAVAAIFEVSRRRVYRLCVTLQDETA